MTETSMSQSISPVTGPQVWRGPQVASAARWRFQLPAGPVGQLRRIVDKASAEGRDQDSFDFEAVEIPGLRDALALAVSELTSGTGMALVRGIKAGFFDVEAHKIALLIIANHMGLIGPQEHRAKGISEVMDVSPPEGDRYYFHVGGPLPMHMDPVDVVGLLCLRKAKEGGTSRIVSSMAVHNEILHTRPDLLELLYRGFRHRRRQFRAAGGPRVTDHYCPAFADIGGGEVICNFIPAPIRMTVDEGLMTLTPAEQEALDIIETISERDDFCLEMDLEPGDLQFLNNRITLHGRADYRDSGGPDERRLLLRTWLTMPGWRKYPAHLPRVDVELETAPA